MKEKNMEGTNSVEDFKMISSSRMGKLIFFILNISNGMTKSNVLLPFGGRKANGSKIMNVIDDHLGFAKFDFIYNNVGNQGRVEVGVLMVENGVVI